MRRRKRPTQTYQMEEGQFAVVAKLGQDTNMFPTHSNPVTNTQTCRVEKLKNNANQYEKLGKGPQKETRQKKESMKKEKAKAAKGTKGKGRRREKGKRNYCCRNGNDKNKRKRERKRKGECKHNKYLATRSSCLRLLTPRALVSLDISGLLLCACAIPCITHVPKYY